MVSRHAENEIPTPFPRDFKYCVLYVFLVPVMADVWVFLMKDQSGGKEEEICREEREELLSHAEGRLSTEAVN